MLVFTIATSLYYISEQLEEHVGLAKRYITRYIQFVMVFHVLLWIGDGLSLWRTLWSLATNFIYLTVMSSFPVVNLTSPNFIAACVGAVSSHFLWFWYFTDESLPSYQIYERVPTYKGDTLPPFGYVASFFGMLIWTVPFLLFLSLSANDNILPTVSDSNKPVQRKGLARQSFDFIWQWIDETLQAFGLRERKTADLPM